MARYQYAGPGPDETSGELIRPGDVREFDSAPDGPWEPLEPLPEPEPAPPVTTPLTAPATPEGM